MLGALGLPELCIIAFIAILIFGPKALPRLMGMVGDGIKALREGTKDEE